MKFNILFLSLLIPLLSACQSKDEPINNVQIPKPSVFVKVIPSFVVNNLSKNQFDSIISQAKSSNKLLDKNHPTSIRVQNISKKIITQAKLYNPESSNWNWQVNVINDDTINAFCMPGGKIIVYTGIINKLNLTDDELAAVIGHEVAHASLEHSREQLAKTVGTLIASYALGEIFGSASAINMGADLINLKFSRDDETSSDILGTIFAAQAKFNPQASLSLWKKMQEASKNKSFEILSTHPNSESRIKNLEKIIPFAIEQAKKN